MGKSAASRVSRAKSISLLFVAILAVPAIAQQPAATSPQTALPVYDAVSIHPHNALDNSMSFSFRPDNFSATNISLKQLVSYAYGIREDLISGLPDWKGSAHFDITAKVTDADRSVLDKLTHDQLEAMFRPVLADRFQLKAHTETKTLPVYDLVLTKDGPKFQKSPPPPEDPDHPTPKGQHRSNSSFQMNNGDLTATAITMNRFADTLADQLNRTVIDKTGLTDAYDLKLKWTRDEDSNNAADNGAADRAPGLFTALQEQLGLKLNAAKGPVETLVVDHAEKPSPN
jgi:uncharacterized protein (TIGR03435 family)